MPLSEHEQRLLDQIERALYAEDPKFASAVRSTDLRTHMRRRLWRAGAIFVVGFAWMVFQVTRNNVPLALAGFVVMLLALVLALAAWRRLGGGAGGLDAPRPSRKGTLHAVDGRAHRTTHNTKRKKPSTSGSPLERLEERWKRRWDERGGPS